jgi:hypothetical protein
MRASWAGEKEELGRTEEKERKSWAGPRGREERRRKARLGRAARKKRERKKKKRVGRAQLEKEGEKEFIQMHFNLNLKFKFKWKINNKTMQWGMKCIKPIFPYISFYG